MNLSCSRFTFPLVAAVPGLVAGANAQQVTVAEALFPGAVAGDRGPLVTRVVDDLTGAPIADAEVFLVAESKTPLAGEFWWTHRGTSDADGFVRIDRPNGDRDWHWQVFRHPVHGTATRNHASAPIWRIGRGQDVPVRIVDWVGRPASGAHVGFCGGCGHSPDLVNAVADGDGLALLRGIDVHNDIADLYVQHPGLQLFYDSIAWRPGDPPVTLRCAYGPPQTGRLLDQRGEPVGGVFVCGGGSHRGPWARTAADGSFTVLGGEPGDRPHRVVLRDGCEIRFGEAPGFPVTLRLPDLADPQADKGVVEPSPLGEPSPEVVPVRHLRVVVEGAPAGELRLSTWFVGSDDNGENDTEIVVPERGPFVLSVGHGEKDEAVTRTFDFADGAPADGPLRVRWLPAPRVRGRLVDALGAACAGRVRWVGSETFVDCADGRFDLMVGQAGWRHLEIAASDERSARRRFAVRVGEPGSGDVDLGTLRVGVPPQLTVVDAEGKPPAEAEVGFLRAGWQQAGEPYAAPLGPDGGWWGPELREGDGLVVERAGHVPFRTVLRGPGPWRLVLPDGELAVQVVDATGAARAAVVVFGDHHEALETGAATLRGLPRGPLRLFVSAPGCRSAIVDIEVGATNGPVRVVLPAR